MTVGFMQLPVLRWYLIPPPRCVEKTDKLQWSLSAKRERFFWPFIQSVCREILAEFERR